MPRRARPGAHEVFLAGWHGHDALPDSFAAADAVVPASVRERFGQALVEAMACGLPAIAVDAHGPAEIIDDGVTGWLAGPDDPAALAGAMAEAIADPDERRARGARALADVRGRYGWPRSPSASPTVYASAEQAGKKRACSTSTQSS